MKLKIVVILLYVAFLSACKEGPNDKSLLPGTGKAGEVLLVIDSSKWNGAIGHEFRILFNSPVPDLPRDQSMFDLGHVSPLDFKSLLKQAKNLVLLVPLYERNSQSLRMQAFFDKGSIDSLKANPDLFLVNKKNLYASNQEVMFIIGHSEEELLANLEKYRDGIRKFFNDAEDKRTAAMLYGVAEEKVIGNRLEKEHNFNLKIPYQYKIVYDKESFVWLRLPGQQIDKNILIAFKDYKDTSDFNHDKLVEWRNEICKKNVFGDPANPDSYVVTESLIDPLFRQVSFNGKYAVKINGLWKTHDVTMGGPFVAYSMVDEKLNRMYYIEGFIYSPGVDQREIMREMDVVLKSFRTSDMN
jgi:hypothetical protein